MMMTNLNKTQTPTNSFDRNNAFMFHADSLVIS